MIKLVAFDWNGTILADTAAMLHSDNEVLKAMGFSTITMTKMKDTFDIPISKFWENLGLDPEDFKHFSENKRHIFHNSYVKLTKNARTRSGTTNLLKWLSKKNLDSIIFSNHIIDDISKHLKRLKIERYFKAVLGRQAEDNSHHRERNKELKLTNYLKENKIQPKEVLCIGDTCEEIEIGKSHGMFTVGLTGGNISTKRLKACKPDFLIHNLKEVEKIIRKINSYA
jgi:phosphoglycolate phosphatase-like HAD superfamily hydrolase